MRRFVLSLLVLAAVLPAGCDSSSPERDRGEFELSITGDEPFVFNRVLYVYDGQTNEPYTGLVMMLLGRPDGDVDRRSASWSGGRRSGEKALPVGRYTMTDGRDREGSADSTSFSASIKVDDQAGAGTTFHSTSGSLTVTSSTPDELSGMLDFSASDRGTPERTVRVTGTFRALLAD